MKVYRDIVDLLLRELDLGDPGDKWLHDKIIDMLREAGVRRTKDLPVNATICDSDGVLLCVEDPHGLHVRCRTISGKYHLLAPSSLVELESEEESDPCLGRMWRPAGLVKA